LTTAGPIDIEVDQLRKLDKAREFRSAAITGSGGFARFVDASVGESKFVLRAADPAAQIYFCACGQEPEIARAGLESAVELLAPLRAPEEYATHDVPLACMSATVAVFRAFALMRIKMEPRRRRAHRDACRPQSRSVVTSRAIAARN